MSRYRAKARPRGRGKRGSEIGSPRASCATERSTTEHGNGKRKAIRTKGRNGLRQPARTDWRLAGLAIRVASRSSDLRVALRSFGDNRFVFRGGRDDGPMVTRDRPTTRQSCRECHQNVVTGGASEVSPNNARDTSSGGAASSESLGGGSLSSITRHAPGCRSSSSTARQRHVQDFHNDSGTECIEAISSSTLTAIRDGTAGERADRVIVPVLEASGRGG